MSYAKAYTDAEIEAIRSYFDDPDAFNPAVAAAQENPNHTTLCWLATVDARDERIAALEALELPAAPAAEPYTVRLLNPDGSLRGDEPADAVREVFTDAAAIPVLWEAVCANKERDVWEVHSCEAIERDEHGPFRFVLSEQITEAEARARVEALNRYQVPPRTMLAAQRQEVADGD